jgi:hypothetical protein
VGAAYLGEGPKHRTALVIPEGAFLVIRGDVSALRRSAALSSLPLDKVGMWLSGDRASRVCGFDPTVRVGEFLAVVPEGGEKGEFAIVAKTTVPKEDLLRCVERLAREGGRELVTKAEGRDTSMTLPNQEGELVYREGGLVAMGQRPFLSVLLATLDGKLAGASQQSPHMRLAHLLRGASEPPVTSATVVATVVLPRSLRERLKAENIGPVATSAMTGVLGVEALGVSLTTGAAGGTTEVFARFACESPAACAEVDKILQAQRLKLSQQIGLRLAGFGPLVDSFKTEPNGPALAASARTRTDDLARALGFAADYLSKSVAAPPPETRPEPTKVAPDEVLKPPPTVRRPAPTGSAGTSAGAR